MRRALLVCGVVSSLVYVAADVLGTLRWEGYSYVDQTISELAAADAPSRVTAGNAGGGGANRRGGVSFSHPHARRGVVHQRDDAQHPDGGDGDFHRVSMGFGASAAGPQFRNYSIATLVVTLLAGAWGGWIGRSLADNGPTPWVGIVERVSVFSYLLWVAVLAIALLPRLRQPDVLLAAA